MHTPPLPVMTPCVGRHRLRRRDHLSVPPPSSHLRRRGARDRGDGLVESIQAQNARGPAGRTVVSGRRFEPSIRSVPLCTRVSPT